MQYMILIYGDESAWASMPPEQAQASFAAFMAYNQELAASRAMRGGLMLKPSGTATTLRAHNGQIVTTDGPFAEAREQLSGYYLIEVDSLDEALAWAAKCPAVWGGSIEVRPAAFAPGA